MQHEKQQQKEAQQVSFSPTVTVHETLHINNYTPEEKYSVWYNRHDYKVIKARTKEIVNFLDSNKKAKGVDPTLFRGLENKTKIGSQRRHRIQHYAYVSVFQEQFEQYKNGTVGQECGVTAIAKRYQQISLQCQAFASQQGFQDRNELLLQTA